VEWRLELASYLEWEEFRQLSVSESVEAKKELILSEKGVFDVAATHSCVAVCELLDATLPHWHQLSYWSPFPKALEAGRSADVVAFFAARVKVTELFMTKPGSCRDVAAAASLLSAKFQRIAEAPFTLLVKLGNVEFIMAFVRNMSASDLHAKLRSTAAQHLSYGKLIFASIFDSSISSLPSFVAHAVMDKLEQPSVPAGALRNLCAPKKSTDPRWADEKQSTYPLFLLLSSPMRFDLSLVRRVVALHPAAITHQPTLEDHVTYMVPTVVPSVLERAAQVRHTSPADGLFYDVLWSAANEYAQEQLLRAAEAQAQAGAGGERAETRSAKKARVAKEGE
jgi:hypothetical protein